MEIEEGEFYRTKKGEIRKVEDLDDYSFLIDKFYFQIVKHSKNIIDLIEVNDLVKTKGEKTIIHIYDNDTLEAVKEDIEEGHFTIETIVTHEMFEGIEYKV